MIKVIHILHIIPTLQVGGAEKTLSQIIKNKQPDKYNHTIVCLISSGNIGLSLQKLGVKIYELGLTPLTTPLVIWKLIRIIIKERPNIVQSWMYHANILGGIVAKLTGVKNIIWGIRTTDAYGLNTSKFNQIIRRLNALGSYYIPQKIIYAAYASENSHIKYGFSDNNTLVIGNGFNTDLLKFNKLGRAEIRMKYNIKNQHLLIGSLGRFNVEKDHHNFIKAADILLRKYNFIRIILVGRDLNKKNEKLVEYLNSTNNKDKFFLLDEQSDVTPVLSAMDIFCLHSRNEGFPNVLGEAMAIGLPCVATDVGDVSLLMKNQGVIVPSEDYLKLAKGLEKLIEIDKKERNLIGVQAKEHLCTNFDIKCTVKKFENIYKELCD